MIFVGIDWSSVHDDVCILDASGKIIKEFRVPISGPGFRELLEIFESIEMRREKIHVGIEDGVDIAAKFLAAAGCIVYRLNPLAVNRFKERYKASAKKDDRFDAFNIARMLFTDHANFTPVQDPSPEVRSLQIHCETIDNLIRERTRLINQLNSCLLRYFPAFTAFFSNLKTTLALQMLITFPRPTTITGLSADQFVLEASNIKRISEKRKRLFHDSINAEAISFSNPDEDALSIRAAMLAQRILSLNEFIYNSESIIQKIFDEHPLSKVFKSIPGAGRRLGPSLLAEFGDNLDRFQSYEQVQCYAGTAPVTKKSGKSMEIHSMRRACNKSFRYALHTHAFVSIRLVDWAHEHYTAQRKNNKTHAAALRSVSHKWAKIIYSMWKHSAVYDEEKFTKKRRAA